MNHKVYRFANWFTRRFVLPFYARYRVTGLGNVPVDGPLIIVSNHLNDADPGVLAWPMPRRLVFMTKAELFKIPGLKQFLLAYGAFPVRRGEADLGAMRTANEVLKRGEALVIFPEGTRSGKKAALRRAHPGTAIIAQRAGVPILPVAITGSQHMGMPLMFLKPFRLWDITLTIGEPFTLPKPDRLNAEAAQAGTDLIMAKIAALLPEQYRGYYGRERQADPATQPQTGEL